MDHDRFTTFRNQPAGSQFTHLLTYFLKFMSSDLVTSPDVENYVYTRNCCADPSDSECAVLDVPEDDPFFSSTSIRCLNMTIPYTFQFVECDGIDSTIPSRIIMETTHFDLSIIYSNNNWLSPDVRHNENGLLKYEELFGKHWPPAAPTNSCVTNQVQLGETRCHEAPGTAMNGVFGINLFSIWFWRNHNYIAGGLAELNPCWDDQTIFDTARDINIAIYTQIIYYEAFATVMGEENMKLDSILSENGESRDLYDETDIPGHSMEFNTALRWFHTIQEGIAKLYEPDGTEVGEIRIVDMALRTGWLANNNQLALATQGAFRQATAASDNVVDPDIAEVAYREAQRAIDAFTIDLAKNRYYGHAPYVEYLNYCEGTNKNFTSFEDLSEHMDPEMIDVLKQVYEDVNDIDLQAGLWTENKIEGGIVPKTFYCIAEEFLKHNMRSDRHWYERPNRPHAFSEEQLAEVKKMTIASLMCLHGDTVTEIQANAFRAINEENPLVSCSKIPTIDLSVWTDNTCSK